ncbi:asparagine synthase (glutamine-hydrolyzing) [Hazenella coriacea]|uniref:asparagine synthase (glutamine-hydrolyzing) n=1 Tax=Hazenella coriacea TaxID=1179467 RepID=A0A4R3LDB5_9BACL|nr:asparagine synthase (glutamine-hydrolyzing) [Hazenella coriacea]TCS95466.1 asparagine synthase (glutamine-hydrolysing) [Hazenella coriacea]
MCGITGWLDFRQDLSEKKVILDQMNQMLIPRGPDAEGTWISKHVALGNRRLMVIDAKGGTQPMVKRFGERTYLITYNGELYNMTEVRMKLQSLGYHFATRSDTELIVTAYAEWGDRCPEYLNGMFAFAVWDERKEELFLARDRFGIKPLFYTQVGTSFLFGSELKALLAHPEVRAEIDDEGIAEILLMGPARTPGLGVFCGIHECKPGHWMRVGHQGITVQSYWELVSQPHTDDFETTIHRVRGLFQDAVRRQLVSDVPIGTMLSGGLDSSAISAVVASIFEEEGRGPLCTYSVDYRDNDQYFQQNEFQPNSDAPWAQLMAEQIQSNHHTVYLDNDELIQALMVAMRARDLPGMADIDASLYLFSKAIRQELTVVLSGESADEVFGGYPWFHREEMVHANTFPWARRVAERISFMNLEIRERMDPFDYVENRYQEALSEVPRCVEDHEMDARMRELFYLNLTRWMPTLLDRQDRMSMAVGLEIRAPFCDHHLVEYVWNIPWSMKAYGQREKGLLRHALRGLLPQEVIERKKSPFPKTHHPRYLEAMKNEVQRLLDDSQAPLFQLIDRQQARQFVQQDLSQKHLPWFGQLMNVPALLAYWLQINQWLIDYKVSIK